MAHQRNKAGRVIWFVANRSSDAGGTYKPVTREGCRAFILALLWILVCGLGGMAAFLFTLNPLSFVGMFAAGAAGLAMFVRAVIRHS